MLLCSSGERLGTEKASDDYNWIWGFSAAASQVLDAALTLVSHVRENSEGKKKKDLGLKV